MKKAKKEKHSRKTLFHRAVEGFRDLSMTSKISVTYLAMLIPVIVLLGMWFISVVRYNDYYSNSVRTSYVISEFNLDFKEKYDYKIYLIVVGNKTFKEEDPIADIDNAERILGMVRKSTHKKESLERVTATEKCLENLEKYTKEIHQRLLYGNGYDENVEMWETGVQPITSQIQQNILEILYYENQESSMVYEQMQSMNTQLIIASVVILVIFIIVAVLSVTFIPRTITRPVSKLRKVMEQAAKGDLTVRARLEHGAELKVLGDSFNTMICQNVLLIDRVREEQKNLREAELEILQMQINPHFLYNTLDTIVWLAEADRKEAVVDMVETLSEFFRSSLNGGKDIVTIAEESRHISSYLQIQSVRYQDILEYSIDLPADIDEVRIPKITLQPLVENALYHGIKNKRGKGCIKVYGSRDREEAVIVIEDNGIGMKTERLEQVRRGIRYKDEEKDFYGLYNVNERIRLKFGEAYGLKIDSIYREGTKVEVHLPLESSFEIKKLTES